MQDGPPSVTLAYHPLADVLPLIEGDEFNELVASIKTNGQRDPIITLDGMILDGRNRYRACLEAGIEPRIEPFTGDDPVAFVTDRNLRRRHLTSGQKAMAVARYATFSRGNPHRNLNAGQPAFKSVAEVAAMVGINKSTVSDAKTICANGTAEEIESVRNGHALITTVAKQVRTRRNAAKTGTRHAVAVVASKAVNGCRIVVPKGSSLSALARKGMALQRDGAAVETVLEQIGLSRQAYTQVRDMILLAERDDLSEKDIAVAKQALREVDETRQIGRSWQTVKPIAERVWGKNGTRLPTKSQVVASDKRRSRQFDNAISFIANTCDSVLGIEIPSLAMAQAAAAVIRLNEAQQALQKLKARIRKGGRV
jgi:hypothetical protein